jgi:hypothetical protein
VVEMESAIYELFVLCRLMKFPLES